MTDFADEATRKAKPPVFSPDGAHIIVLSGASKGTNLRIPGKVGGTLRIGKSSENDLTLEDDTISRQHLLIERVPSGIRVHDLESTNGVFVSGAKITEALVEPGTVIRVGNVDLLIGIELEGVATPASNLEEFGFAVGTSAVMRRLFGVLERAAPTSASVLLTGETGTGKDVLARSTHMKSARADGPFEVLDCGAVTSALIESELFGHERGAFTGAVSQHMGVFERARGGTLFLDEVGELALGLQPKLLRVLEAHEFRRVGGKKLMTSDVRVIAATTRNLREQVQRGAFRDDLYFRLAVVSVEVPPLRARIEDIPVLARRLIEASSPEAAPPKIEEATLAALKAYDWPGNIRELRNVLDRSLQMGRSAGAADFQLVDFPPAHSHNEIPSVCGVAAFEAGGSYREVKALFEARFEQEYIAWLLAKHDGNVSAAARHAKMDRNHLTDLARRHGLDRKKGVSKK
jgi:DNA-binding NtrC family response regulator